MAKLTQEQFEDIEDVCSNFINGLECDHFNEFEEWGGANNTFDYAKSKWNQVKLAIRDFKYALSDGIEDEDDDDNDKDEE